jgi:subtilisin-like proprotein convertase family protein
MDPATLNASDVRLADPLGRAVALTAVRPVAGTGDTQFEVLFNVQTTAGRYALGIGAGARDLAGRPLDPYGAAYTLTRTFTYSSAAPVPIPDVGTAVSTTTVGQDVPIDHVTVTLNITHSYDSDLYIHLQSPDGINVTLVYRRGGAGHGFVNTVLDDAAAASIRFAAAPFTGTFQPEASLSFFNGAHSRGVWKLCVQDLAAGDSGVINGWSLTLVNNQPGVSGEPDAAASPGTAAGTPVLFAAAAPAGASPAASVGFLAPPGVAAPAGADPAADAARFLSQASGGVAAPPPEGGSAARTATARGGGDVAFASSESVGGARAAFQLTPWVGGGGDEPPADGTDGDADSGD